jgi:hypothetical protein
MYDGVERADFFKQCAAPALPAMKAIRLSRPA